MKTGKAGSQWKCRRAILVRSKFHRSGGLRERSAKDRTLREGRGEGGGGGRHFPASSEQVLHKFLPQPETGIKFSRNFCWNFSLSRRYVLNKKRIKEIFIVFKDEKNSGKISRYLKIITRLVMYHVV